MEQKLRQGVDFSHDLIKKWLKKGGLAIDATAGNGHDTLYLAKIIGQTGQVIAFDIQKSALKNTEKLLNENQLLERVSLHHDSHLKIDQYAKESSVDLILFNLGYLPGGDKQLITEATTTLAAVKKSLELLKANGLLVVVLYPGHAGGEKEKERLIKFCKDLNSSEFNVLYYHFINQRKSPAELVAVHKRG